MQRKRLQNMNITITIMTMKSMSTITIMTTTMKSMSIIMNMMRTALVAAMIMSINIITTMQMKYLQAGEKKLRISTPEKRLKIS